LNHYLEICSKERRRFGESSKIFFFYLLEVDRFSSSSEDEFDDDFCSDVEATASEPERDLKNQNYFMSKPSV
jgi:hypothetical protein